MLLKVVCFLSLGVGLCSGCDGVMGGVMGV